MVHVLVVAGAGRSGPHRGHLLRLHRDDAHGACRAAPAGPRGMAADPVRPGAQLRRRGARAAARLRNDQRRLPGHHRQPRAGGQADRARPCPRWWNKASPTSWTACTSRACPSWAARSPSPSTRGRTARRTVAYVDFMYQPLLDAAGKVQGIFIQGHDVTEQHRAQQALREADQQKDEFLATLAHELRNPLAPLRSAAHLLSAPGASAGGARARHRRDRPAGGPHVAPAGRPDRHRAHHAAPPAAEEGACAGRLRGGRRAGGVAPARRCQAPRAGRERREPLRAAAGRPGAHDAGAVEPAEQRVEVHRRGRPHRTGGKADGGMLRFSVTDNGIGLSEDALDRTSS